MTNQPVTFYFYSVMRLLIINLFFYSFAWGQVEFVPLDYGIDSNWAVLNSNFDSINGEYVRDSMLPGIDVFFVFPTLIVSKDDQRWNAEMDDIDWKKRVQEASIKFQASAFANTGRTFAPYYRQAHLRSYSMLEEGGRDALLRAYEDIRAAFQYYLDHYNNGNGIILAGHSQGSTQLMLLLKEFFTGKELNNQLVAAYLPGISLKENEFPGIPLMKNKDETGGFVTWNTFKWNYDIPQYHNWYEGSAVIDPITWTTHSPKSKDQHKGFLYKNGKCYTHCIKTEIINGGVRMKPPRFPFRYLAVFMKHYHIGDINFFWEDIRENCRLRAKNYLENIQNISD